MVVIMYNLKQLGKYQSKDMIVYIDPLIDVLPKLWDNIIVYDICKPIRHMEFQFRGIIVWRIHDALGLTHFCGM